MELQTIFRLDLAERIISIGVGLFYSFFGLNGFAGWFPPPTPSPALERFLTALRETNYLMMVVKALQILAGVMLVLNVAPLVATLLLAPIVFVIVSAHFILNRPHGLPMASFVTVSFLLLVFLQGERWSFLWRS